MVLADRGYSFGKHYIEISVNKSYVIKNKLETEPDERTILFGVCLTKNDFYFNYSDFKNFWGYIPSEYLYIKLISDVKSYLIMEAKLSQQTTEI